MSENAQRGKSGIDPQAVEQRLVVARALAAEHGMPLGFHDEEDQLDWDRKAQKVLRELAEVPLPREDIPEELTAAELHERWDEWIAGEMVLRETLVAQRDAARAQSEALAEALDACVVVLDAHGVGAPDAVRTLAAYRSSQESVECSQP